MLCQRHEEARNIETDRRPEKRMKPNVAMESDAPKPRTMDAVPGANVDAELMLMERVETEVAEEEAPVPEFEKLKDDMTNLAEEAMLDQDEELPHPGLGYLPTIATEAPMPPLINESWRMNGTESYEDDVPEANVDAGLLLMEIVETEVAGEEALVPKFENLGGDLTNLAEEATLDQDDELPHPGLGYLPTIVTETAMPPLIDGRWRMDGTESYEERHEKRKIWARVYGKMYQELRQEWRRRRR